MAEFYSVTSAGRHCPTACARRGCFCTVSQGDGWFCCQDCANMNSIDELRPVCSGRPQCQSDLPVHDVSEYIRKTANHDRRPSNQADSLRPGQGAHNAGAAAVAHQHHHHNHNQSQQHFQPSAHQQQHYQPGQRSGSAMSDLRVGEHLFARNRSNHSNDYSINNNHNDHNNNNNGNGNNIVPRAGEGAHNPPAVAVQQQQHQHRQQEEERRQHQIECDARMAAAIARRDEDFARANSNNNNNNNNNASNGNFNRNNSNGSNNGNVSHQVLNQPQRNQNPNPNPNRRRTVCRFFCNPECSPQLGRACTFYHPPALPQLMEHFPGVPRDEILSALERCNDDANRAFEELERVAAAQPQREQQQRPPEQYHAPQAAVAHGHDESQQQRAPSLGDGHDRASPPISPQPPAAPPGPGSPAAPPLEQIQQHMQRLQQQQNQNQQQQIQQQNQQQAGSNNLDASFSSNNPQVPYNGVGVPFDTSGMGTHPHYPNHAPP